MPVIAPDAQVAPTEQVSEFLVAPTEVEDKGQWHVLLEIRDQEIEQEALAAAGCTHDDRVRDVLVMQVEKVWRTFAGFEDSEILAHQMSVLWPAAMDVI